MKTKKKKPAKATKKKTVKKPKKMSAYSRLATKGGY